MIFGIVCTTVNESCTSLRKSECLLRIYLLLPIGSTVFHFACCLGNSEKNIGEWFERECWAVHRSYCWLKCCISWYGEFLICAMVSYIPASAGFPPWYVFYAYVYDSIYVWMSILYRLGPITSNVFNIQNDDRSNFNGESRKARGLRTPFVVDHVSGKKPHSDIPCNTDWLKGNPYIGWV